MNETTLECNQSYNEPYQTPQKIEEEKNGNIFGEGIELDSWLIR